jgi:hypothetical protein
MAIMVQFKDNTASFVPDYDLKELILSNSIIAFRRGAGWVEISAARNRGEAAGERYDRPERRGSGGADKVWKRIRISELQ